MRKPLPRPQSTARRAAPSASTRALHPASIRPSPLAILGGPPAFAVPRHVGRPNIGRREDFLQLVDQMFDRRWLTNRGPLVQTFEQRLEAFSGAKHCITVSNGTTALELMIRGLGLTGEVIVPSFTFIATVHALRITGLTPVFCDVDPATHNINPAEVERLITPATSGILGVHLWGRPCHVDALQEIADRHDLKLMFDAAHAFASSYNGRMVGTLGDAEVYSFHATKFVNTFEGGAVVTNDDALALRIRQLSNFGFGANDFVEMLGTNAKMSEINAAMGLTSLDSMEKIITANRINYAEYRQGLEDIEHLQLIEYDESEAANYQYIIVEVGEQAPLTRDELITVLHAENVLARRYFSPGCHRMEPYRTEQPDVSERLPHTEMLATSTLALPTGTAVDPSDVRTICRLLTRALTSAASVRRALEPSKPVAL